MKAEGRPSWVPGNRGSQKAKTQDKVASRRKARRQVKRALARGDA